MKSTASYAFPFGLPVCDRAPQISGARKAFILGAYPSALHIYWQPPAGYRPIQAIAVDNEPDFFWNGDNEPALVADWQAKVGFSPAWGQVRGAGKLNGSSGLWVDNNVLKPFGLERGKNVWISDCLPTYRLSKDLAERLEDTYQPFAEKFSLPQPVLRSHPSEDQIVQEALSQHKKRIISEITGGCPEMIITLGNAALRVVSALVVNSQAIPRKLSPDEYQYGQPIEVTLISGNRTVLYPLAHPAAPPAYQTTHAGWINRLSQELNLSS